MPHWMGVAGLSSALSSAAGGLTRSTEAMADAATRLSADVSVEAATDLVMAEAQGKASAVVARAVNETMGTLIDVLA